MNEIYRGIVINELIKKMNSIFSIYTYTDGTSTVSTDDGSVEELLAFLEVIIRAIDPEKEFTVETKKYLATCIEADKNAAEK